MSKELECLKRIDMKIYTTEREHRIFYSVVEQSLKRLEAIDNTNPSEALKCFENMQYRIAANISTIEYTTIKQALLKAEQDRKAIELLKKGFKFEFDENIDIGGLMYIKSSNKKIVVTKHYDKEQLDLLKQVIEVEE